MRLRVLIVSLAVLFGCVKQPPDIGTFPASPYFFLDNGCVARGNRHYFLTVTVPGIYSVQYIPEWGDPVQTSIWLYYPSDKVPTSLHLVVENRPTQVVWAPDEFSAWQVASRVAVEAPTDGCSFI